jgi:predicted short-subunit dehydrogenase-like oxidoreductase (DUF2520 family)
MPAEVAPVSRHLWIIGPGRLGLAIGSALVHRGVVEALSYSGRSAAAPAHPLFSSPAVSYGGSAVIASADPQAVLITVPDAAIAEADGLVSRLGLPAGVPILHTSGALSGDHLTLLRSAGHPTGSLHPLASVPDNQDGGARLIGAWWGVEGDPEALRLAGRIVAALDGRSISIDAAAKPLYHAAAVFASNYVVTILAVAEQLFTSASVDPGAAREIASALAAGAVANCARVGPEAALTGPVRRGDTGTLRLHLERLSGSERALYSVLAATTLEIARNAGLSSDAVEALDQIVQGET